MVEISEKTYNNMLERCRKEGKHRYRRNAYGAWCTVCGYYGGLWISAPEADPEGSSGNRFSCSCKSRRIILERADIPPVKHDKTRFISLNCVFFLEIINNKEE